MRCMEHFPWFNCPHANLIGIVWCKLLHALNVSLKLFDGIVITSLDDQKKQAQICAKYATYCMLINTIYTFLSSFYGDCFACFYDSFASFLKLESFSPIHCNSMKKSDTIFFNMSTFMFHGWQHLNFWWTIPLMGVKENISKNKILFWHLCFHIHTTVTAAMMTVQTTNSSLVGLVQLALLCSNQVFSAHYRCSQR